MMGRRVKQNVIVPNPVGQPLVLAPGDEVPAWAADLITNPAVFEGATLSSTAAAEADDDQDDTPPADETPDDTSTGDEPAGDQGGDDAATDADSGDDEGTDDDGDADDDETPAGPPAPPKSGKGSGIKAWTEYAERIGVTIPDGADRDAIIAAVDAALED